MPIQIGWYDFEDPTSDLKHIEKGIPCIFIVIDLHDNNQIMMLDVDYSFDAGNEILKHERKDCWSKNSQKTIAYTCLKLKNATEDELQSIYREIRTQYDFPCGEKIESPPFRLK